MTTCSPNQVFCFLLAVTVVNAQNAGVSFCGLPKVDALTARKLIAQQLLENKYNQPVEESPSKMPRRGTTEHCLVSLPRGKQFVQGQLATCRSKYQTWKCSCKLARVRIYCQCTPGVLHCSKCYAEYVADAAVNDLLGT